MFPSLGRYHLTASVGSGRNLLSCSDQGVHFIYQLLLFPFHLFSLALFLLLCLFQKKISKKWIKIKINCFSSPLLGSDTHSKGLNNRINRHKGIHQVLKSGELPQYCLCNLIPYILLLQFNWELQKFQRWGSHRVTRTYLVIDAVKNRAVGAGGRGGVLAIQWTLFQQGERVRSLLLAPLQIFRPSYGPEETHVGGLISTDWPSWRWDEENKKRENFNIAYGLLCWLESLLFAFRKVTMIFQNRLNKEKGKSRTPLGNLVVSR